MPHRFRKFAPLTGARLGLAVTVFVTAQTGCTTYRIIRYRQPDARNQGMFPSRLVRKADTPFEFAIAPTQRSDLDSLTVRAPDNRRIPFQQYMAEYSVLAFVVIRNDTVLYERYRDGMTAQTIHSSFSMAKSVLSALVGIALADGAIKSLDQPVTDYLPYLRHKPAYDGVTIRHLLEMKSGLRYTKTGKGLWSDFRSDEAHIYYAANLRNALSGAVREMPPGTKWVYKDTDADLLGLVVSAATGKTVAAFTEERLWRRIGTEHDATWSLDRRDGDESVASGFNATARDFARFGRLYLNGGAWEGRQIVPAGWVAASVAVDSSRREPEISNWWQMQHTLYWWHPIQPPAGEFYADGSHGQRIYVDPKTRTIIVQLANKSDQDFPFRKIVAYLNGTTWDYPRSIPSIVYTAAVRFGADSIRPAFERSIAQLNRNPEGFVITQSGMLAVGSNLLKDQKTLPSAIEVYRIITQRYPMSAAGFLGLAEAYEKSGDKSAAADARRHATDLSRAP
jgi:CubicO group peptidase (beta-lactamase class C family)